MTLRFSSCRRWTAVLLAGVLCAAGSLHAQPSAAGYTTQSVRGFDVLVLNAGTAAHPAEMRAALNELDRQLGAIGALDLATPVMDRLRAVKIFVDWAQTNGAAQYHPSREWLIQNGYAPEKERSVEISNAVNFVNWSGENQPWMVFHELTHAYHHQVLGYGHGPTLAAYQNAVATGLLDSVPYNPGGGRPPFNQVAYAKNNEMEYLAEISEAYVGRNDYYPHVRSDLRTYDPQGYALAASIWTARSTTAAEGVDARAALAVYPNPSFGPVTIEAPEPLSVTVHDVTGRTVATVTVGVGQTRLDLGTLPAGVYHLRAVGERAVTTRVVVLTR